MDPVRTKSKVGSRRKNQALRRMEPGLPHPTAQVRERRKSSDQASSCSNAMHSTSGSLHNATGGCVAYTPPCTLVGTEDEGFSHAGSQAAARVDSVPALLSWLDSGPPSQHRPDSPKKLPTKFRALKYTMFRPPYAREVQLRDGCIITTDPVTGEQTNKWPFDRAVSAVVEPRGDGAVLWLMLPGRLLPVPRQRTQLEVYMPSEALAQRTAMQLGFEAA